MEQHEFNHEFKRLVQVFGDKAFPSERVNIIWKEVKSISHPAFEKMINFFVGEFRHPPVLSDFLKFMSQLREQAVFRDKEQLRQDSRDFWAGTYHDDEVKYITGMIKKRMMGQVTDEEYDSFKKDLLRAAEYSEKNQREGVIVCKTK